LPQNGEEVEAMWAGMLKIMELQDTFHAKHPAFTTEAVLEFMIFDRDNPAASTAACGPRENAHAVRGTLTSELWETSNETWLKMRDFSMAKLLESGPGAFFEWVKYRSHLSRGVTIGTMLQDEALRFIRLGTFLERADNTARILEVKYLNLLPGSDEESPTHRLLPVERAAAVRLAFEVYRKVYRDQITPARGRAADPAGRHAALPGPQHEGGVFQPDPRRQCPFGRNRTPGWRARVPPALRRIERIFEGGLRKYLEDFRDRIFDLGCGSPMIS
jgi:hypothetical protein